MHPKSPKLLDDIVRSCEFIIEYTTGTTFGAYIANRMLRQAVERNLEIIGEELGRLRTVEPDTILNGIAVIRRNGMEGYS